MSKTNQLTEIIAQQKSLLSALEQETNRIQRSDLTVENEGLKKEVEQLRTALAQFTEKANTLSVQNRELKDALFDQIYSERIKIADAALQKKNLYFKSAAAAELNQLTMLERSLQRRIQGMSAQLHKYRQDSTSELEAKLKELSSQVGQVVTAGRAKIAQETGAFSRDSAVAFEQLKSEQMAEEDLLRFGKKGNLEHFVGGNIINKLGILFVLLGIIAVSRFTFVHLADVIKGVIMFAISGGFLAAGELLNRKKTNVFSLGVTSAGVAGLYASLSISYFGLEIIFMYPALFLCLLTTAGAFVLSQRYQSQTIAAFALIGGYIPLVSISESAVLTYGAMVYFVVLNFLALSVSFYQRWKINMFIGFFLNLFGTLVIIFNMAEWIPHPGSFGLPQAMTILYVVFAFATYTLIPMISNARKKETFVIADIVILGLNTFFSALIMYGVFLLFRLNQWNGLLAIAFAVCYIALGRWVERRFVKESHTSALFYLTGLTFVILVIPFQFGAEWLSLGWLVQAVALLVYGILNEEKSFKRAGLVVGGFCLASFLFFDVLWQIDDLFAYKYFAVTLGSIAVLAALAHKKALAGGGEVAYKYVTLVNLWIYGLYAISLLEYTLYEHLGALASGLDFLMGALSVVFTLVFGMLLPRVPVIADKGTKIIAVTISILGMLSLLFITSQYSLLGYRWMDAAFSYMVSGQVLFLATLILIAVCALAVLAMRNVLLFFVLEARLPVEWLPFGISAYFLLILTQNLVAQYHISLASMIISIVFVVAALGWIIYGFVQRFAFLRRFGLGLSVLAVAKLFLVDLSDLTQGAKIISYFAFGVTLLGISFVYQYFSKRLAPKQTGQIPAEGKIKSGQIKTEAKAEAEQIGTKAEVDEIGAEVRKNADQIRREEKIEVSEIGIAAKETEEEGEEKKD